MSLRLIFLFFIFGSLFITIKIWSSLHTNDVSQATTSSNIDSKTHDQYYNNPIDRSVKILPSNFKGVNLYSLIEAITNTQAQFKKGDFETTFQYNARLQKLRDSRIFEQIKYNDDIAVTFNLQSWNIHYDADKQKLDAIRFTFKDAPDLSDLPNVAMSEDPFNTSKMLDYIIWNETSGNEENYIGTNAFGVQKVINKSKDISLGLFLCNARFNSNNNHYGFICGHPLDRNAFSISMSPQEAKLNMYDLKLVLIGKIPSASDLLYNKTSHTKPTISDPTEKIIENKFIKFKLSEIWLVGNDSGNIYKKIVLKK